MDLCENDTWKPAIDSDCERLVVGEPMDFPDTSATPRTADRANACFRVHIDAIPALAWCSYADGSVEFLNQRWLDYSGLSDQDAIGWGWLRALHPEDSGALVEKWQEILLSEEEGEAEARLLRFDGEYRWFLLRAVPFRDERGNIVRWYGINTDIEERKRAELELRDLIDYAPLRIGIEAADGRRLYANRSALDYLGITLAEYQSAGYPSRFVHPEDIEAIKSGGTMLRDENYQFELRLRRKDGVYRWHLFTSFPFRDSTGRILRWYLSGIEIENRKQMEQRLQNENTALHEEIERVSVFEEIVGGSDELKAVLSRVSKVAPTDSTVLITGETGTGKELIARAIHKRSSRSSGPFVAVNCAAIPQSLLASELFGHEKGAFTGALQRRLGRFERACGGTLFLDEIGELPAETQIALLRVLQERAFERVGGNQLISADVRVIAATNRDLSAAVAAGSFRSDLFYRLDVFPIEIPPLRLRGDDIPMLAHYFIERYATAAGKRTNHLNRRSMELLRSYSWPGNIRELQNVIERSVILCETETLSIDENWLSRTPPQSSPTVAPLAQALNTHEKTTIEAVLAETRGRVSGASGAAAKLGMKSSTLESKIRALKINKHTFRRISTSS